MNQERATTGQHPTTVHEISSNVGNIQTSNTGIGRNAYNDSAKQSSYGQQEAVTGSHPTTVDDIDHQNNVTHNHNGQGTGFLDPGNIRSPESSTRSDYGSSSDDRSSVSQSQRPVADRDAFITPDHTKDHWQFNMTPAERAKHLAAEMKSSEGERRRSSVEKLLRIGGKKDIKLE
ncbi:hypothetical protein BDF20DRAFT_916153 [Mycotypha africana]|uniref:uncharacterized protein n=1 Tax=Mycotypha africana TaxID=64632 RepID=UPI0023013BDC|nr:uncharacterized protein BDF20DRAFT_916153 [Mycotypha africana]KAI8970336.1 hypothetical protein BDF20DRAFT_916153 [Mycotypha africana]